MQFDAHADASELVFLGTSRSRGVAVFIIILRFFCFAIMVEKFIKLLSRSFRFRSQLLLSLKNSFPYQLGNVLTTVWVFFIRRVVFIARPWKMFFFLRILWRCGWMMISPCMQVRSEMEVTPWWTQNKKFSHLRCCCSLENPKTEEIHTKGKFYDEAIKRSNTRSFSFLSLYF